LSTSRQTIYGKTQKEVSDKLRNLSIHYGAGDVFDSASMVFKEWLDFWLENYKKLNLKQKTYEVYERFIILHISPSNLGQITLKKITSMHIQRLINDKYKGGLSTASIRKMFNIIKQALQKAVDGNMLLKNPASSVELPEHKQKDIEVFTMEEQERFFEFAKDDVLYDLFVIAVDTGIRLGELLAINWQDVDLKDETISITKNLIFVKDYYNESDKKNILKIQDVPKTKASIRKVPLTQRSLYILKKRKIAANSHAETVFLTSNRRYLSPRNVERSFCRIVAKAKLPNCNFHSLRHTYATRMFEIGTSAKIVSEILGHSKVSHTLDIYTHVIPSLKNNAVKNLDLLYEKQNIIAK
jgi:integrase